MRDISRYGEPALKVGSRNIKIRRTSLEGRESSCFLCEKESPASEMRQAMTMQLNERVNDCDRLLNDGRLLAKLSGTRAEVSPNMFDWPLQQREGVPDIHWGRVQARKITERRSISTGIFRAAWNQKKWRPNQFSTSSVSQPVQAASWATWAWCTWRQFNQTEGTDNGRNAWKRLSRMDEMWLLQPRSCGGAYLTTNPHLMEHCKKDVSKMAYHRLFFSLWA